MAPPPSVPLRGDNSQWQNTTLGAASLAPGSPNFANAPQSVPAHAPPPLPPTHEHPQDTTSSSVQPSPLRSTAPSPSQVSSLSFYVTPEWVLLRAGVSIGASYVHFLKMLASLVLARMQGKEAPHYGTWDLAAASHCTDVKLLVTRLKLVVSTICPQYPLEREADDDSSDSSGDDPAEDDDGGNLNSDTNRGVEDNQSRVPPNARGNNNHAAEIAYRTGSTRIPDFVQLSHVFDLATIEEDLFKMIKTNDFDVGTFATSDKKDDLLPHIRSRVTLLFEIKPEEEDESLGAMVCSSYKKQLKAQAKHFFEGPNVKEDRIGGVLGVGRRFTYREFLRKDVVNSRRLMDDRSNYVPPVSTARYKQGSTKWKYKPTEIEKELQKEFGRGERFLDMHSPKGKHALSLINERAKELFPVFWSDKAKYNAYLRPRHNYEKR
ncbi:hypothetical protein EV715DRAFT_208757 [Schizophyllum commune]